MSGSPHDRNVQPGAETKTRELGGSWTVDGGIETTTGKTTPLRVLSIVTTAYRSQASIAEFIRRALAAAEPHFASVEVIVVDDGSPDRAADIVRELAEHDGRIVLVKLSRNFGHHKALITGLEYARGDFTFLLDSDLEEEPENLGPMLDAMRETGADVIYGVQQQRKGGWVERVSGELFYDIFGWLSEIKLPRNVSTIRLMTRRYLDSFLRFRDHNPVLVPLGLLAGFKQAEFTFTKQNISETTYSLGKRFSWLLLVIPSFTGRPLLLLFWLSLVLSLGSFLFGMFVVVRAVIGPVQDGWSSLMAAILFFFSLNALFTGMLGLYIKLILDEVKDRPRTVVQEVFRKTP